MRVYKPTYKARNGEYRQGQKYAVEFTDTKGVIHRLTLFGSKEVSVESSNRIIRLIEYKSLRRPPDQELQRWLDGLPNRILSKLAEWGIIDPATASAGLPLDQHLTEWAENLRSKGKSEPHIKQTVARVHRIISNCQFRYWIDIAPRLVEGWIAEYSLANELSAESQNGYRRSLRAFCNWGYNTRRISDNPIRGLSCQGGESKCPRRSLKTKECRQLLRCARQDNETIHGMNGYERFLLYLMAIETNLRWSELWALTVKSLRLDQMPPVIVLRSKDTKNKRGGVLPLRVPTAVLLKELTEGRESDERLFHTMWRRRGASMLRHDLDRAGIPFETDDGRIDFHALRGTGVSALSEAGAHITTTQKLARHASIETTVKHYTRVQLEEMAEAVNLLPDFLIDPTEEKEDSGENEDNETAEAL